MSTSTFILFSLLKVTRLRGNMVSIDQTFYYEEVFCFRKAPPKELITFQMPAPLTPVTSSTDSKKAVPSFGALLKRGTLWLETHSDDRSSNGIMARQHVTLLAFRGMLAMTYRKKTEDASGSISPSDASMISNIDEQGVSTDDCKMKAELLAGDRWIARQEVLEVDNQNNHITTLGLSLGQAGFKSHHSKYSNDNVLLLTLRSGTLGTLSRWRLRCGTRVALEEWLWALRYSDLGHGLLTGTPCPYNYFYLIRN